MNYDNYTFQIDMKCFCSQALNESRYRDSRYSARAHISEQNWFRNISKDSESSESDKTFLKIPI